MFHVITLPHSKVITFLTGNFVMGESDLLDSRAVHHVFSLLLLCSKINLPHIKNMVSAPLIRRNW